MRFTNDIVSEIKDIERKGESQFSNFGKDRLVMGKVPINAKIQKNNFSMLNTDLKTKSTSTIPSSVINKLKSAIAYRPRVTSALFQTELNGITQSLAEVETTLYHGTKSKLKDRIQKKKTFQRKV